MNKTDLTKADLNDLIAELNSRGFSCFDKHEIFAKKLWSREDIASQIENYDVEPTDELIDAVIKSGGKWHGLTDCDDGEWLCIQVVIEYVLKSKGLLPGKEETK